MDLPEKHLKSTEGQILILFLLVLVVGIAIVLSVASRTITDIRTTTTSDESNRAYFAAEAGIEEALQQLQGGGSLVSPLNINFPTVNTQATTADVTPAAGGTTFIYPNDLAKDDVAQISMLQNFNDIASAGWDTPDLDGSGSELHFFWGRDLIGSDPNQAIEVTIIWHDGTNFGLTKIAFDPAGGGPGHINNFCNTPTFYDPPEQLTDDTSGASGLVKNFYFSARVLLHGDASGDLDPGCDDVRHGPSISGKPVLIRIRALYNTAAMPIAVRIGSGEPNLYTQGTVIESTGTTASGVTRKLQVIRLYPALPALFDYVLFSGSDLSK